MNKFNFNSILKLIILILLLNIIYSSVYANACNPLTYINDESNFGDRTCSSDFGILIDSLSGDIYCSLNQNDIRTYEFKSLNINNSNISFINCEIESFFPTENNITITNSNISLKNSIFRTQTLENNFTNEFLLKQNNTLYSFKPVQFDLYLGDSNESQFIGLVDVIRDFNLINISHNSTEIPSNLQNITFFESIENSIRVFNTYLPFSKVFFSTTENLSSNSYNISFQTNLNSNIYFNYSNFLSINSSINQISIEKSSLPIFENESFELDINSNTKEFYIQFGEFISELNLTLINSNTSTILANQTLVNISSYARNYNSFVFNTSFNYEIQFELADFFGNRDVSSIIITNPNITNSQILSYNPTYTFYSTSISQVNATLTLSPTFSLVNSIEYLLNPSNNELFTISNNDSLLINYANYSAPLNSDFTQDHITKISNFSFNFPPILIDNNSNLYSEISTNNTYDYGINSDFEIVTINNNSKIESTLSSPRYFNQNISIEIDFIQTLTDIVILNSFCEIQYESISQNLTYNIASQKHEGNISFLNYLPLEKSVIINCFTTENFENITKTIIVNQTAQPIDNFTTSVSIIPKNPGSQTTNVKNLSVQVFSNGSQNINPLFDNEYFIMISKFEYLRNSIDKSWNTTENLTSWINIGKNEIFSIVNNDSSKSKNISIILNNGTILNVENSFIFKDIRDGSQNTNLFTIVKSCVPGDECKFFSDNDDLYIFEDTTPPILFNFNSTKIANSNTINFTIDVDDLESSMKFSTLEFIDNSNSSNNVYLNLTNFTFSQLGISSLPIENVESSLIEGRNYSLQLTSENLNNFSSTINLSSYLLIDNQASTNSTLQLDNNNSFLNTSPLKFYSNSGNEINFTLFSGVDNFSLYEVNSGIGFFNISTINSNLDCNLYSNITRNITGSISDNSSFSATLNFTNNSCNIIQASLIDRAGNLEFVEDILFVVDSTAPVFILKQGLFVAPISGNNFNFNLDSITNSTILFGYEFEVFDNLSNIETITVNLYERENYTGNNFSLVKQFSLENESQLIEFSLSNYTFKDGTFYKIGVIGTNFANISTQERNSSPTYLTLSSTLLIEPTGFLSLNSTHFIYNDSFSISNRLPIEFKNTNLAQVSCSIANNQNNYTISDPNQCSLVSNNSKLKCNVPNTFIESNLAYINCFINNSNELSEDFFSNEVKFLTINNSQNELNISLNKNEYLDNETIYLSINSSDDDNSNNYIYNLTLDSPVFEVNEIILLEKGIDLNINELIDLNATPLFSRNISFNFIEDNSTINPSITFVNTSNSTLYTIKFNSSLNQSELDTLIDDYNQRYISTDLFKELQIQISSPITLNRTITNSNFNTKIGYTSIISPLDRIFLSINSPGINFNNSVSVNSVSQSIYSYSVNLTNFWDNLDYLSQNNMSIITQNYFSNPSQNILNFNVSYANRDILINNSINTSLNVTNDRINTISLEQFFIFENDNIGLANNKTFSVLNQNSSNNMINTEILTNNSGTFLITSLINTSINNSPISILVKDNLSNNNTINLNLNWNNETNISRFNNTFTSIVDFIENKYSSNINTTPIQFTLITGNISFEEITISINNTSIQNKILNKELGIFQINLSSNEVNELINLYDNGTSSHLLQINFRTYFDNISFNQTYFQLVTVDFDKDGVPDSVDIDLDNDGINDTVDTIILNETIIFQDINLSLNNVSTNINTSNISFFEINSSIISSPIVNSTIISWEDNNSQIWDFSRTTITIENKTFSNSSLNGFSLQITEFPKFDSKKSITIPQLNTTNTSIRYCIKDNENTIVSNQCDGEDEYILQNCNTSLSSNISCIERGNFWEIKNLSYSTIETVCVEDWSVGSWSGCSNNQRTRSVIANHNCNSTFTRPASTQACSSGGGSSGGSSGGGSRGGSSGGSSGGSPIVIITPSGETQNNPINDTTIIIPEENITIPISNITIINNSIPKNTTISINNNLTNNNDTNQNTNNNLVEIILSNIIYLISIGIILLLIVIIIILILVKKKHTKSNQKINQGVTRFNENTNNSKPLNNVDINVISNNYLAKKYDNKTLSKICFENNIHLPNQVKEFLDKIGIETYLIKIRNLLNEYAQELGTAKTLELLKNQNWHNSLNIIENSKSYEDDLGFFITQSLIIKEFNKEELLEIIEDSILKEIKNTNQN